jgi:hypothetical protein
MEEGKYFTYQWDARVEALSSADLNELIEGTSRLNYYRPQALIKRMAEEILVLRKQVEGHCRRITEQSELLSRKAEKQGG